MEDINTEESRKMAYVGEILDVKDIENSDFLQHYRVNGWWVVDKKGSHNIGDKVVYCEIDSWIPHKVAPFLTKGDKPSMYKGIEGNRLKTIKLRKALSQGLILALPDKFKDADIGMDLSNEFGIIKYESELPVNLRGVVRGSFPSWIKKTNQERIQNCSKDVQKLIDKSNENKEYTDNTWVVEEKLDGSSMTVGIKGDDVVVCSRNLSLDINDESNAFVNMAKETNIIEVLKLYNKDIALQGELCGKGIQGNKYKIDDKKWFIFDIWDVKNGEYVDYYKRQIIIDELVELGACLHSVPKHSVISLPDNSDDLVGELLEYSEGKSLLNGIIEREGLVFKNVNYPSFTFKVINNNFLLKGGDD